MMINSRTGHPKSAICLYVAEDIPLEPQDFLKAFENNLYDYEITGIRLNGKMV